MLEGRLIIDGKDIWTTYGAFVTNDGWTQVAQMPALKKLDSNDWQEENGTEYDLSAPVLDKRELSLSLAFVNIDEGLPKLAADLCKGAYHEFNCLELGGRTLKLRLLGDGSMKVLRGLGTVTIKLADDFPFVEDYRYIAPTGGRTDTGWLLDDRDFADYGLQFLEGTIAEFAALGSIKLALLRSSDYSAGCWYDPLTIDGTDPQEYETAHWKARNVKLYLLMRAANLSDFWRNWDALLFDLSRPQQRTLSMPDGNEVNFIYGGCSVSEFKPSGRPWLKMTLSLTLTSAISASGDAVLLTTEDGALLCLEGGKPEYIDLDY